MIKNAYIPRYLSQTVLEISKSFPVVLITGARQVGKTTLFQHTENSQKDRPSLKHRLVSLDEFGPRTEAKRDPSLFFQKYPGPLFIDEVQYAPELFSQMKFIVDRDKIQGQYWLTGSQQFHMWRNVSESLAGRVGILRLLGLSLAEKLKAPYKSLPWTPKRELMLNPVKISLFDLFGQIIRGSFPRLFQQDPPALDAYYGAYIQTYIDRDLRDFLKAASLPSFEKFVRVCAARTAGILNLTDLARDSAISVATAKQWLGLLEMGGHIFLLYPYANNRIKRLVKAPKLYFLDTGLVSYLTGWREVETTMRGAFAGQLYETFVVSEILKSYYNRGLEPRIYYYRTKEKAEIDVLLERDGQIMPVEIKLAQEINPSDIQTMTQLRKLGLPIGKGAVIAPVNSPYPVDRDILVLPPTEIS